MTLRLEPCTKNSQPVQKYLVKNSAQKTPRFHNTKRM